MKRLHTLFLFLTIAFTLIAQPICQVKHFSVSDGLAQGVVMNILQDQKGLIWFSTWNGLRERNDRQLQQFRHQRKLTILRHKLPETWS